MPNLITANDFREFERDCNPDVWDAATMRRLVPFLDGADVIVVTVRETGTAVQGRITGIVPATHNSDYPHIALTDENGDTTLYRVSGLGPIMVLGDRGATARWQATNSMFQAQRAALRAVQQFIGSDFPAGAPYKGRRQWLTTLTWDGHLVRWGESPRDRSWQVDADGNASVAW